eukprot:TRINITY_DN8069_c0_g1_i2.p1 TRINITY_DN8069_c0_g1~~TRINITY_DN8069_c0_g1_i2.p1  ORF type:complete len:149 (-),score=14.85 TRINITY_DN8069_c0_g1_i2:84-530(-)
MVIIGSPVSLRSVWLKNWNPRWIQLTDTHLLYYKYFPQLKTKEPNVRGKISLATVFDIKVNPSKIKPEFVVLEVYTKERVYCFSNMNNDEASVWIKALRHRSPLIKSNNVESEVAYDSLTETPRPEFSAIPVAMGSPSLGRIPYQSII